MKHIKLYEDFVNESKFNFLKAVGAYQLNKNEVYYAVSLRDGSSAKLIYARESSDAWEFDSYPGGTGSVPYFFDETTLKNEWFSKSNNSKDPDTVLFTDEKDALEASKKIRK
jgi:hypothetical protein